MEQNLEQNSSRLNNQNTSLSTPVETQKGSSTLKTLRALSLVVLGGLGGAVFSKATDSEAEVLAQLDSITSRIETIDQENNTLMNELREALEIQAETGDNMEEVNRILSELIADQKAEETRVDEGLTALEDLQKSIEESIEGRDEADAEINERLNDLAVELQAHEEANRPASELELWDNIMAPTVRLQGRMCRGSGVMLESKKIPGQEEYETLVFSNHHVVDGIRQGWADPNKAEPIEVVSYDRAGNPTILLASVVLEDAERDIALLRIVTKDPQSAGVKLPTKEEITEKLQTFNEVYAAGCPMGVDPIPSKGQITDPDHTVGGKKHMLVSSPTFSGNSGGPVMDAETYELLGLVVMVYTRPGTFDSQIISHMGIVIPVSEIYSWLEENGLGNLIPKDELAEAPLADAKTAAEPEKSAPPKELKEESKAKEEKSDKAVAEEKP